jgi:surface polysaccharide O-acyltransferase-like enzyme
MKERIVYLDILRVICGFFVIVLHVSSQNWSSVDVNSFTWDVFNFFESLTRFTVPVFVMISGSLFLNNSMNITVKNLYKKNILRLVTAYIGWSFIYAVCLHIGSWNGIRSFVVDVINGYYHMWFVPMMIGLYILVPVLRMITADKKVMQYFIVISVFFCFFVPVMLKLPILSKFNFFYENMNLYFQLGYVSYFVLGSFLMEKDLGRFTKIVVIGGGLGIILTCIISKFLSMRAASAIGYYGNDTIPVLLSSIAVFVGAKYICSKVVIEDKWKQRIHHCAAYSMGVYFVHPLWVLILKSAGVNTLIYNPVLSVPLISIIVYILSVIAVWGVRKIPVIRRLVV